MKRLLLVVKNTEDLPLLNIVLLYPYNSINSQKFPKKPKKGAILVQASYEIIKIKKTGVFFLKILFFFISIYKNIKKRGNSGKLGFYENIDNMGNIEYI
jgi:hypothetical protein